MVGRQGGEGVWGRTFEEKEKKVSGLQGSHEAKLRR